MRTCARCGCPLSPYARSDARFCGSTCRRETSRARKPVSAPSEGPGLNWTAYRSVTPRSRPTVREGLATR